MNSRRAFTLIELLVAVATIGILAALLLPAVGMVKSRAQRTACLGNLGQINLGTRMYCDDYEGRTPVIRLASGNLYQHGLSAFFSYRRLIKSYVGVKGEPSPQDKIFACPSDTFCYDVTTPSMSVTYVNQGAHTVTNTHYSSYAFNGGISNIFGVYTNSIGIGNQKLTTIRDPVKTVMNAEVSALFPYSWHEPGNAASFGAVLFNNGAVLFDDAKNMVSFVDGHIGYIRIFWNPSPVQPGVWALALQYNPPPGYDYKWSGD
jgi:prepilin-type N-terminal cleavage/methylation domain-containing protein